MPNIMIIKIANLFREYIKNMRPRDIVYPGILVVFFGIIIVMFFFAAGFISKNVNKVFYFEESSASEALNLPQYELVAKKLNITVHTQSDGDLPVTEATQVVTAEVATSTTVVLDKSTITIIVKNSTTKKGVATTLAKTFEDAGFKKPLLGNEPKFYATTTVLTRESKKDYESILLEVVRKSYPEAVSTTTADTGSADAIVVIGVK